MNPAVWVYLSTIIFLTFVLLKSYKLIVKYFEKQQEDIKKELFESEEFFQKAQNFYDSYREKIEILEIEANDILKKAQDNYQKILNSADEEISKAEARKNNELLLHIEDYKMLLKKVALEKCADLILDDVKACCMAA